MALWVVIQSDEGLWRFDMVPLIALRWRGLIFMAYVSQGEQWGLTHGTVHVKLGMMIVCACCTPLHVGGYRCWVTEGLDDPPLVQFLNPPYLTCSFSKTSLRFCGEWKQVNYKIVFPGIWSVWLRPLRFFFPLLPTKCSWESKGRSVPSWVLAFVLLLSHWKQIWLLSTTRDGEERGKAKLVLQHKKTCLCECMQGLCVVVV